MSDFYQSMSIFYQLAFDWRGGTGLATQESVKKFCGFVTACFAFAFTVACASAASSGAPSDRIIPPQMTSRAPMPQMRFSGASTTSAVTLRADIEVVIDSTGVPDMSTFKTYGNAAMDNRNALYEWIQNSAFRPAVRNGQPVSAVYHTRVEFRVQRR